MSGRSVFVAQIVEGDEGLAAANPFLHPAPEPVPLVAGAGELGDFAVVQCSEEAATIKRLVAPAGSARAALYGLLAQRKISPLHPPEVMREAKAWGQRKGIDDPALEDLTGLPFVTVDGPGTRDLDQALCVLPKGAEYTVYYALADASYYVRPGSALFREALRRGASYYLPGMSAPMLPRSLCEDLISLNPRVDRRATVFEILVDGRGIPLRTRVIRGRVHSRARLTFDQVERFLDGERDHRLHDEEVQLSLRLLERVGELRLRDATQRDVIAHRSAETRIRLDDGSGLDFVAIERVRNRVELYSEQLSLMCNTEGATLLRRSADEGVQPIYRVHAPPPTERLDDLVATIDALVEAWELPQRWRWDRATHSLGEYLRGLPEDEDCRSIREAIGRQALLVNVRSTFTSEPSPHFGIGADVYARFSAPMREIVGVFVHKELWELLADNGQGPEPDEALRDEVIEAANKAKHRQRELTRAANHLVLDRLFAAEIETSREQRPVRDGTVLGMRDRRVYVRLAQPPVDVKLYVDQIAPNAQVDPYGVTLHEDGEVTCRLGQEVRIRLSRRDDQQGRWILELVP